MNTEGRDHGDGTVSSPATHQPANGSDAPGLFFVAGATTFLGSHFLLSRAGEPGSVVALVEGGSAGEAAERLRKRLESAAASRQTSYEWESDEARLRIIPGDLRGEESAPGEDLLAELRGLGVREFWHFPAAPALAADVSHDDILARSEAEVKNALRLAGLLGVERFVYVSTACAAGRGPRVVREELHALPREFNNACEESHCRAEHEVAAFCGRRGIDYRILRPGVVIGPSLSMRTGGSTQGLYGFVAEVFGLRPQLEGAGDSFTVVANPEASINLLPVDSLMAQINDLAGQGFGDRSIYHLTSAHSLSVEAVLRTIWQALGLGTAPKLSAARAGRSPAESLFDERVRDYSGYLLDEREFEATLPRPEGVSEAELYGYVVECLRGLQEQTEERLFEPRRVRGKDGTPLRTFVGGNPGGPAVVLCNAIGMPAVFWMPVSERLAPRFRILTWESRGVPGLYGTFDPQRCSVADHVDDLSSLLDFYGVEAAHLVGWCSGVSAVLKFASSFPERTLSLALLNGAFFLGAGVPQTTFEKNVRTLFPKIAANAAYASLYYRMISGGRFKQGAEGGGQNLTSGLPMCRNPSLRHLTAAPFRTPEVMFRYANLVARTFEEPEPDWSRYANLPVLIVTSEDDQISHPEASREVARRIPGSELVVNDAADHHSLYDDARVGELLLSFLTRHEAKAGA